MKFSLIASLALAGVTAQLPKNFGTTAPHQTWGICNTSLSIDDRAKDIVSRISLADKIQERGRR